MQAAVAGKARTEPRARLILASDARMREVRISSFDEASAALRNACLVQSMYDAGAVIMDKGDDIARGGASRATTT